MKLCIDIETYSDIDIKNAGVHKYVDTPNFEILLFGYVYNDEDIKVVDLASGEKLPEKVLNDLVNPNVVKTAFNASFEMTCISRFFNLNLNPDEWECTMVYAYYIGLSGGLGSVAKALGLDEEKDATGNRLISYFSKPCKPTKVNGLRTKNLPMHDTEKWEMFKEYCKQDVVVEREIRKKLESVYTIPEFERALWSLDYKINNHGVRINKKFVDYIVDYAEEYSLIVATALKDISNLENTKSNKQIRDWIESIEGFEVSSIAKGEIDNLISKCKNPKTINFLNLYKQSNKTSIAKYQAMINGVCDDGVIKGLFQFYGARTGRWAGRRVQLHNLPRNNMEYLDDARNYIMNKDFTAIEMIFDNPTEVLSELIRTAFEAHDGYKYLISDFSAIEARIIAWLSGENWRLDVFKTHGKIYEASASQMFNIPIEAITKGSELRQKGKIAELALGYQGSVGALKQMGAVEMGLKESELQDLVDSWRLSNPSIVRLWYLVGNSALHVIRERTFCKVNNYLSIYYKSGNLYIKLPSKRELCYYDAKITKGKKFNNDVIEFKDGKGKSETYGGKLVENIVQAVARDCLAVAMMRFDNLGYKIVMHVHDEIILEVPEDENHLDTVNEVMAKPISWAKDLPLKGDSYESKYYVKD